MKKSFLQQIQYIVKASIQEVFFKKQWNILYKFDPTFPFDLNNLIKLPVPKDRFWADPFVISKNGKYYIFVEEFLFSRGKGRIAMIEMDKKGNSFGSKVILEKPYHLSYPFIFKYEDDFFMIPESFESQNIQLYKCVNFPCEWKFKMNLMWNVIAADPTLFYHNKKWWLFTTIISNHRKSLNDKLYLFYADHPLTTNWIPHPMNPIISDPACARPAGRIFEKDGKILRPSQDCSNKYGYGFNLHEIELMNEDIYKENLILSVRPEWDSAIKRTHSYYYSEELMLIDGMYFKSRISL